MPNDRLNHQAGNGSRNPKYGYVVNAGSERFKDAAYVRVLQGKAKLDTKKTETHIPDFPEG
jgi:hypothetical protein